MRIQDMLSKMRKILTSLLMHSDNKLTELEIIHCKQIITYLILVKMDY